MKKIVNGEVVEKKKHNHGIRQKGTPNLRFPELQQARASLITEWKIKGVPNEDIAKAFNMSEQNVRKIIGNAVRSGIVEETRERMSRTMLPLAANVYQEILTARPEELQEVVKAQELRLKAARQISEGLGALGRNQTEVVQKQTLNLEGYQKIRQERLLEQSNDVHQQRQIHGADQPASASEDGRGEQVRSLVPDYSEGEVDGGDGGSGDPECEGRTGDLVGSEEVGSGATGGTEVGTEGVKK